MKPLVHPPAQTITVEGILHALADPVRVTIFAQIAQGDCARTCSDFLGIGDQAIPKSTLSHHFKTLREAGLIRSERRGTEMLNTSRCEEIDQRFPGMLASIMRAYSAQSKRKPRAA